MLVTIVAGGLESRGSLGVEGRGRTLGPEEPVVGLVAAELKFISASWFS